jgi:uncharacterized protein DUF4954/uncharacterized protein DUF6819
MTDPITWRALAADEVAALEANGCRADDWSAVEVRDGFRPEFVARCTFSGGKVRLGVFTDRVAFPGGSMPGGVYDCHIHNSSIACGSLVRNVGTLANYDVEPGVLIDGCGLITVDGETSFGNGVEIDVFNEGGGRELRMFERLSAQIAYLGACYRHRPKLVAALDRIAVDFAESRKSDRGTIGVGARVRNCATIKNVRIGEAANVDGAMQLEDGAICSCKAAPTTVGAGVIAKRFIIGTGSKVDGRAIVTDSFIGQACQIGRKFSAEACAFFANGQGFHGEAVSLLGGPYTVTHHKSTLLIACMLSFYNAGSGTNQSNHMYKLGPVHQGILERGSKTGSFSYLLWPARVGAFTAVMGKHYTNFDSRDLPFSYVTEEKEGSVLSPAVNLFTVGTKRDGDKWPSRDGRTDPDMLDLIHFPVFSPLTVGRCMNGLAVLTQLYADAPRERQYVSYGGIKIKRLLCRTGKKQYTVAIQTYLGGKLADRLESGASLAPSGTDGAGDWVDVLGMLAPQSCIESLCDDIERGEVADLAALEARLRTIHAGYDEYEWNWVCQAWSTFSGKTPAEMTDDERNAAVAAWQKAAVKLNNMILGDAAKEFDDQTRLGFGIDGDESVRDADFEAVRGAHSEDKFVRQIRQESEVIKARAEKLLG